MKATVSSPAFASATRSVKSSTKRWMGFENKEKRTSVASVTTRSTMDRIWARREGRRLSDG